VQSAQGGLGAAIHGHPDDYPLIAVFPQAEKTWKAGSDDAKAALAALDDVMKTYKCDRRKVILTGLSMGGSGTWSIAMAEPDRFSAVVPVCGRGDVANAKALKDLPVWAYVGDADSNETVLNTRDMVLALRAGGGKASETEYRGVGHNSWDRAYNDPSLIAWMIEQARK
jgi:predicted peptidase